ncbi:MULTISPECIES: leucine efflux protein LeuE [Streptomyces]|uniref:Leucine efflux protein LeuE n=2 Tax=Streptomyces TaxID=1883 RepID=A0A3R7EQA6_9ACTN|nr:MULTISPECIES: leucine efflux protein LeuE [Streptomyces]KNE83765.1 membrane protein [Streptomyces fradiae]OFA51024.1 leucine efflux protein LeuE [Streptomyces fradiae]PQM19954.1 leucine efflux protein LeuE [Streptomyces xinghaiensis]RKM94044.1 leucine efflux protein LeuE [Streptomyces xinghaiensis]RNC69251.1 leucine efflux protein LeuE [Streptomyces xinghaiensis]
MLGVTDLPTYLVGLALIILLPGPNSLYVLSVAARRGVRRGYAAAGGVFCGDAVLMLLSAAGVASLLQANALLYSIVKYAGAGYLTWLAVGMLRAAAGMWRKRQGRDGDAPGSPAGAVTGTATGNATGAGGIATAGTGTGTATGTTAPAERPFRRALVISLLNPKAILFFVSFFVQFVDPGYAHPALSFLLLGTFCTLFSFLYLTTLILGGSRIAERFRSRSRLSAGVTSAAGALFLGFAVKLSLSSAAG